MTNKKLPEKKKYRTQVQGVYKNDPDTSSTIKDLSDLYLHKIFDAVCEKYYFEYRRRDSMNSWITHQLTIVGGYLTILILFLIQNIKEIKNIWDSYLMRNDFLYNVSAVLFFLSLISYVVITICASIRILRCMYYPYLGTYYFQLKYGELKRVIETYELKEMREYLKSSIRGLQTTTGRMLITNNKTEKRIMKSTKVLVFNAVLLFAFLIIYFIIEIEVL